MSDQQLDVATMEVEPKSLTNIYYDCLERIFDFLDLESLMNVAGTCKRLQIAAAAKYADKFGNARVMLSDGGHNNKITQGIYDPKKISIRVFGLRFCLTFLRCFGAKLLNLSIDSTNSRWTTKNGYRFVGRYIIQYCADTMVSIHFVNSRLFSSEIFSKPFKAVEKLGLSGCNLGDQLPNFVNWFPNLKHLTLYSHWFTDDIAIAVSFPHLEHLNIQIDENGSGSCTTEDAIKFLHANQQLQSLDIYLTAKFDKLLDVISANKFILKLKVFGIFTDLTEVQLNRLASEHPLLEELRFEHFCVPEVDVAIALIRQLNSLKRFQFEVKGQTECDRFLSQLNSKWKHEITPFLHNVPVIKCLIYL